MFVKEYFFINEYIKYRHLILSAYDGEERKHTDASVTVLLRTRQSVGSLRIAGVHDYVCFPCRSAWLCVLPLQECMIMCNSLAVVHDYVSSPCKSAWLCVLPPAGVHGYVSFHCRCAWLCVLPLQECMAMCFLSAGVHITMCPLSCRSSWLCVLPSCRCAWLSVLPLHECITAREAAVYSTSQQSPKWSITQFTVRAQVIRYDLEWGCRGKRSGSLFTIHRAEKMTKTVLWSKTDEKMGALISAHQSFTLEVC